MTKFYTPQQVEKLTGVSPESLRDWRRRGVFNGGIIPLQDGWTRDRQHKSLSDVGRITWAYLFGEVVTIAVARQLSGAGIDLASGLKIGTALCPNVCAWATDHESYQEYRNPRYAIAWPSDEGEIVGHQPIGELQFIRLDDLSRIPLFAGSNAIFIDLKKTADRLPQALKEDLDKLHGVADDRD